MIDKKMMKLLKEISKRAYVPYSNFHVVALFENSDGSSFYGVNIENAAYPNTLCAERVGIHSAIKDGINLKKIKVIHIYSPDSKDFLSPCGACRQTLSEHLDSKIEMRLYNNKGEYITFKFEEIFPFQVNKENIKNHKKDKNK